MIEKDASSYLFEWDDGIEFSAFTDAVLRYVYGTIVPKWGGRVENVILGRPKHSEKESYSTRVARIHAILGSERFCYYVGLSAKHNALREWKVDWWTTPILGPVCPLANSQMLWLEK